MFVVCPVVTMADDDTELLDDDNMCSPGTQLQLVLMSQSFVIK